MLGRGCHREVWMHLCFVNTRADERVPRYDQYQRLHRKRKKFGIRLQQRKRAYREKSDHSFARFNSSVFFASMSTELDGSTNHPVTGSKSSGYFFDQFGVPTPFMCVSHRIHVIWRVALHLLHHLKKPMGSVAE